MYKEDCLKIIEHFGLRNQLKKLNEENFELIEAILEYCYEDGAYNEEVLKSLKKHIREELADNYILLKQIKEHLDITDEELILEVRAKLNRTLERIENGYYDKN